MDAVCKLCERTGGVETHADPATRPDGDGGPAAWNLPSTYALGLTLDTAERLEGLADAIESDQRHLDRVSQAAHGWVLIS